MPELPAARRGAGPRLADGVTLRRTYRKADAGLPCDVCNIPTVKPLNAAGIFTHPTCGDDMDDALEAYRATMARRARAEKIPADIPTERPAPGTPPPAPAGEQIVTPSTPGSITGPQLRKLHATLHEAGIVRRDRQLAFYRETVFRDGIDSSKDLSLNEACQVIDALERVLHPNRG